jgi:regulator of sigma E protease
VSFWLWVAVGILSLGVMVLVHEFGHFLAAKLLGVRVEVFSIGFGTRLLGRRRGDTDYRLSALPLGGYVKMAGDTPGTELSGAPWEFLSKPRWQRTLIVLAGPAMNLLTAVALLTGLFAFHYERDAFLDQPAVIGAVEPDSPAAKAGLQPEDRIIRYGPLREPTWEQVLLETAVGTGDSVAIEVERAGAHLSLALPLSRAERDARARTGWLPKMHLMVQGVSAGLPAERAGLRRGDQVLAVDGEPMWLRPEQPNLFSQRVQQSEGKPLRLTIEREGGTLDVTVAPVFGDHPDGKRWILGVTVGPPKVRKELTLAQAFGVAVRESVTLTGQMLGLVGRLMTGRASLHGVQGPVGIAAVSGEVGERGGAQAITYLLAAISLSLGILNLLPIPILDGGHIVFFAIEGALRRDVSLRVKEISYNVAFVFLLLLAAVVMYNDIARILRN